MAFVAFCILGTIAALSALFVIMAKNPVHSVLWLILTFLTSAGLFVLIGAEFIAMLLIVVYVGAVAVLFMFVVMMLDVDFVELKSGALSYWPFALLVGIMFFAEIVLVSFVSKGNVALQPDASPGAETNTEAIGQVMYTDYLLLFQLAGLVLLVAMIGAIVLTLRHRPHIKRQNIAKQTARRRSDAIDLVEPDIGKGI